MRMNDIVGGKITLDGIDLSTLTGSVIRERLNCLTQDPFLFPATIRRNADPQGQTSDDVIVGALQKVNLWGVLQDKASSLNTGKAADSGDAGSPSSAVLDMHMDTELLSHGQRQLFCLARAILKPGKVLILDEPTSRHVVPVDLSMLLGCLID
jgi:ATP-binding cassette, subfamily C (CFTR/MRP), member 1